MVIVDDQAHRLFAGIERKDDRPRGGLGGQPRQAGIDGLLRIGQWQTSAVQRPHQIGEKLVGLEFGIVRAVPGDGDILATPLSIALAEKGRLAVTRRCRHDCQMLRRPGDPVNQRLTP